MSTPVAELLDDPLLPDALAALQQAMDVERQARARFYNEVDEDAKAEFINGRIVMHSPARAVHLAVKDRLQILLRAYVEVHRLGVVFGEKALCVFPRNDYEPDVVFFGPEKAARIEPSTRKFPIPDFVCEILPSPPKSGIAA